MRPRLVFIDDDPKEIEDLGHIVRDEYDYDGIRWPLARPIEKAIGSPPDILVLDLYFPAADTKPPVTLPPGETARQLVMAQSISQRFNHLYQGEPKDKELLRETFSCIRDAYNLLWEQCRALKQSADNGRSLLVSIKQNKAYRSVPIVFYSRKVTVEDAIRCLKAGAVAVILKPDSPPTRENKEKILAQLEVARSLRNPGWRLEVARLINLNINVTMFSQDFVQQKAEIALFKASQ